MSEEDFESLSTKAEAAFRQAAAKVIQRARQTGTAVIVWEDGRIKEIPPVQLEAAGLLEAPRRPTELTEATGGEGKEPAG